MTAKEKYVPLGVAVECITADQYGNKDIDDEIDNPQHEQGGTYLTDRLGRCHWCASTRCPEQQKVLYMLGGAPYAEHQILLKAACSLACADFPAC